MAFVPPAVKLHCAVPPQLDWLAVVLDGQVVFCVQEPVYVQPLTAVQVEEVVLVVEGQEGAVHVPVNVHWPSAARHALGYVVAVEGHAVFCEQAPAQVHEGSPVGVVWQAVWVAAPAGHAICEHEPVQVQPAEVQVAEVAPVVAGHDCGVHVPVNVHWPSAARHAPG